MPALTQNVVHNFEHAFHDAQSAPTFSALWQSPLLCCAPLAVLALRRVARLVSHPAMDAKLHNLFLRGPLRP